MATILPLERIRSLLDVPELIDAIEDGFVSYSRGEVSVPPVGFLHLDDPPGDVHIKYGVAEGDDYWVLKVASAFYENPERGRPVGDGVMLLFSRETGALELVLEDRAWLTDMRTAAAGAVAARHLAPADPACIGIVGTGVQARMQLEMLAEVVDCRRCLIWGRSPDRAVAMIEELRERPSFQRWGLEMAYVSELDELASQARLIVTTTPATEPLLRADMIRPGTHITAVGSDDHGKQELEAAILGGADIVVADSRSQCVDHGECGWAVRAGLLQADDIVELGEVIADPELGRTREEEVTVADLTGVAIQDIRIAHMVERAHRR